MFALETSIVGSIGVVAPGFGVHELMKQWGIERRLLTAGDRKGVSDPFSPLDEKDKRCLQVTHYLLQYDILLLSQGHAASQTWYIIW